MSSGKINYWYFDKEELEMTPSTADGIDFETQCQYRKEGVHFLQDIGTILNLGHITVATGAVFFHRFYLYHSFESFPLYITACCCLFFAGKVEETPKKCNDIIKTAKTLLPKIKFAIFGDDPKQEIFTLEKILLTTLKFDTLVEHPYQFVIRYSKLLRGNKVLLQKVVQMAWTFVNDSFCTTLCLQWEPEIIAIAAVHLAAKLSKFEVLDWKGRTSRHLRWWDMFVENLSWDSLEDICHQLLDLFSDSPAKYSTEKTESPDSPSVSMNSPKDPVKIQVGDVKLKTAALEVPPVAIAARFDKLPSSSISQKSPRANAASLNNLLPFFDPKTPPPTCLNQSPTLISPAKTGARYYYPPPPGRFDKPPPFYKSPTAATQRRFDHLPPFNSSRKPPTAIDNLPISNTSQIPAAARYYHTESLEGSAARHSDYSPPTATSARSIRNLASYPDDFAPYVPASIPSQAVASLRQYQSPSKGTKPYLYKSLYPPAK